MKTVGGKRLLARSLLLGVSILFVANRGVAGFPELSKAGFFEVENSGREVLNFNVGWRLFKGDPLGAQAVGFDDSAWDLVNCPNGIEYNSSEASGGCNYQGSAWYRKHFTIDAERSDQLLKLYFEAVMGKCKVWLNGQLIGEHFGGYLPFTVNLSDHINVGGDNVVAVWADNRDDPTYPPGKPQDGLDFTYFGGIYRDVWLVATSPIYVTNPMEADRVAGGGVFVHIDELSAEQVVLGVSVDVQNDSLTSGKLMAELALFDPAGSLVATATEDFKLKAGHFAQIQKVFKVAAPHLWTPWSPDLYRLEVVLRDAAGLNIDGVATRVGLRKIEFKGKAGLFLNNQPYPGKLMGANRHQDHGYVGYSIPNNGQWRDAQLLKDASCDIVRAAHYPADPAFMDACDELGMFFIVATPGWQFWNDEPIFEKRVYKDIRNMVRRDRNHASVILWEPVLNETKNPDSVSIRSHEIVHEEYPYAGAFTVCDSTEGGQEVFDVIYTHTEDDYSQETRSVFQREFGSVKSANTPNRMSRNWGERAQLVQAEQYAESSFKKASLEMIHQAPPQFVGGALWHAFDHFAGKHPRPFYGGIVDVFRQPKYSYYLFASQRDASETVEPMVYLAHEVSPISESDVEVYTNCEEVRLTVSSGLRVFQETAKKPYLTRRKETEYKKYIPHPIVHFKEAFCYVDTINRPLLRSGKGARPGLLVEGLIGGEVVATMQKNVPLNGSRIQLHLEDRGVPLVADGSDFVLVVATIVDSSGTVVRLQDDTLKFEVSGAGALIGDESIGANPRRLGWGSAPLLIRSTLVPGNIKIKASVLDEGPRTIQSGELEIESIAATDSFVYTEMGSEKK